MQKKFEIIEWRVGSVGYALSFKFASNEGLQSQLLLMSCVTLKFMMEEKLENITYD